MQTVKINVRSMNERERERENLQYNYENLRIIANHSNSYRCMKLKLQQHINANRKDKCAFHEIEREGERGYLFVSNLEESELKLLPSQLQNLPREVSERERIGLEIGSVEMK